MGVRKRRAGGGWRWIECATEGRWKKRASTYCERGCMRDDYGKAGSFSVARLRMDLPFVNVSCVHSKVPALCKEDRWPCSHDPDGALVSDGFPHRSVRVPDVMRSNLHCGSALSIVGRTKAAMCIVEAQRKAGMGLCDHGVESVAVGRRSVFDVVDHPAVRKAVEVTFETDCPRCLSSLKYRLSLRHCP